MDSVYGISVGLVISAITLEERLSVFSKITQLNLMHGSVEGDLNDDNGLPVLEEWEVMLLLQQVSPILKELDISQCDVMTEFQFPALTHLYNWDDGIMDNQRELTDFVIDSCPQSFICQPHV